MRGFIIHDFIFEVIIVIGIGSSIAISTSTLPQRASKQIVATKQCIRPKAVQWTLKNTQT
jgi:uncharacterized membrane protein